VWVKGDHTNFEIDPFFGVEATDLYPDVKYTTVDEYLNKFLLIPRSYLDCTIQVLNYRKVFVTIITPYDF